MNPLVYHVASGQSLFSGIVLMIAAAQLRLWPQPIYGRLAWLALLLGVIAIVISSTAIPYWIYGFAGLATLPWFSVHYQKAWQHWAPHLMMAAWLIVAACEVPYHAMPTVRPSYGRSLAVIGDSVTAGVDGDQKSETWPTIFAREHNVTVQDISHVGETAASALKRVRQQPVNANLVFIEIGGNDLLGSTTAADFGRDLDALLAELTAPNRQLIMLELPLPPFYHEYGRSQRTVATKHHVALIPKRVFLSILASNGATLDTIHLSAAGHQQMADTVWELVGLGLSGE